MERLFQYGISVQMYTAYQRVTPARFCNGFTLVNGGTTLLLYNNMTIQPGQSIAIGGNAGEIFDGMIEINFLTQTPPPSTITNLVFVIQKFYKNIDTNDP